MDRAVVDWLLASEEPWTRYRTLVDLLGRAESDSEVQAARQAMVKHAWVQALIAQLWAWAMIGACSTPPHTWPARPPTGMALRRGARAGPLPRPGASL